MIVTAALGREMLYYDLYNIAGLKYHHFLFPVVLLLGVPISKIYKDKNIYLIYIMIILAIVSSYMGMIENNYGVFFNLNYPLNLCFFFVGYTYVRYNDDYEGIIRLFVLSFYLTIAIKEIQLLTNGSSLFFTFEDIRRVRDFSGEGLIKGSSDTILTLGGIALFYYYFNKKSSLNYFLFLFISFVLVRYGVRSSLFSVIIIIVFWFFNSLLGRKLFKNYKGCFYVGISILLLLFVIYPAEHIFTTLINTIEEQNLDPRGTLIWRIAIWHDVIYTVFSEGQYLVGISGQEIKFNLLKLLGLKEYINPHNSYMYLILNFGFIQVALLIIFLYNTIIKPINKFNSKVIKISISVIMSFILFAVGTPVFELPYQGSIFFFLLGSHYKLLKLNNRLYIK